MPFIFCILKFLLIQVYLRSGTLIGLLLWLYRCIIPNFYYLAGECIEFCNNAKGQFFSDTRFSRVYNIKIISIHRDFFIIVLQTDSVGSRLLKVHLVFLLYFDCCFYVVFL